MKALDDKTWVTASDDLKRRMCEPFSKFLLSQKKSRKTRKSPGTLGFKKFGPGKLWVRNDLAQNKNLHLRKYL